ncbi:MAG: hypothetical protein M3O28_08900, partial [Actinomycetota bacterium]|nr:hypothetical protein [Actinomycetota bacterium]
VAPARVAGPDWPVGDPGSAEDRAPGRDDPCPADGLAPLPTAVDRVESAGTVETAELLDIGSLMAGAAAAVAAGFGAPTDVAGARVPRLTPTTTAAHAPTATIDAAQDNTWRRAM